MPVIWKKSQRCFEGYNIFGALFCQVKKAAFPLKTFWLYNNFGNKRWTCYLLIIQIGDL